MLLYREIFYTGKSLIKRHPIRIYIYIFVYIHTHKYKYRENYTEKSFIKGNPVYRDFLKGRSLVKGSLVKGFPINGNRLIRGIHYKEQSITYKRSLIHGSQL